MLTIIISLLKGSLGALKAGDYMNHDLRLRPELLLVLCQFVFLVCSLDTLLEQDNSPIRSFNVIGIASIVMGLLLLFADYHNRQTRGFAVTGIHDGLLVGLAQA